MEMVCLHSKITVPLVAVEAIERERLFDLLQYAPKKLTVVRAPAGYGKTTMLSQWFSHFDEPVAWLSIDPADNDPIRFWRYVIHTVADTIQRDIDAKLFPLFNIQPQLPLEVLVDTFLNELGTTQDIIHIAIDDYHLIENATIHEMMTRFIDYLPNNVHVYITSRTELPLPITKWRVKSWLSEIGKEQLRFTYADIERLYKNKKLAYQGPAALQYVLDWTEGWAAGIQLVGLTPGLSVERENVIHGANHPHPFITEFLLNEILAMLPSALQDFLIRTSIVNELEPIICNALTGRTDSDAILQELEQRGLFINRLHPTHHFVFRYHQMFIDALQIELRKRYSKEMIDTLYEEAATLLHDKGDIHAAIELALANDAHKLANRWIALHIVAFFESGQTSTLLRWVRILLNNEYEVHPETLVMTALILTIDHNLQEAKQVLSDLEQRLPEMERLDKEEYARIARSHQAVKAYVLIASGEDMEQATEMIGKKLEEGFVQTKWDELPFQYNRFEPKIIQTSIGSRGKLWPDEQSLPFFELLRESEFTKQNMTGFSYGLRAETLYERNRIDEAWTELQVALQYGHDFHDPGLFVPMYLLKARIYATKKQFIHAYTVLDHALENVEESHWKNLLFAMKAHCHLLEGDAGQAEIELYKLTNNKRASKQAFWLLVQARLLLATKEIKEALLISVQVKEQALQDQQVSLIIEAAVLEASCQLMLANEGAALEALHEALTYGAPYQYVRTFLDEEKSIPLLRKYIKMREKGANAKWDSVPLSYIEHLAAYNQDDNLEPSVVNRLTPREQDVLKLLASGASNIEIASQLVLTEGTVRIYLTKIYSKLGVNSRTQAVLLAKEWDD